MIGRSGHMTIRYAKRQGVRVCR